jgi:hypothetical protein
MRAALVLLFAACHILHCRADIATYTRSDILAGDIDCGQPSGDGGTLVGAAVGEACRCMHAHTGPLAIHTCTRSYLAVPPLNSHAVASAATLLQLRVPAGACALMVPARRCTGMPPISTEAQLHAAQMP